MPAAIVDRFAEMIPVLRAEESIADVDRLAVSLVLSRGDFAASAVLERWREAIESVLPEQERTVPEDQQAATPIEATEVKAAGKTARAFAGMGIGLVVETRKKG